MFLKEIETMKKFSKSVEKKFKEIENFITSLSVNNHILGTPEKKKKVKENSQVSSFGKMKTL